MLPPRSDSPEPPSIRKWIKSSRSSGNGCCVEVSFAGAAGVLVRDSKFPRHDAAAGPEPMIAIEKSSWLEFLDGIAVGKQRTSSLVASPQADRGVKLRSVADGIELSFTAPGVARLRRRSRRWRASQLTVSAPGAIETPLPETASSSRAVRADESVAPPSSGMVAGREIYREVNRVLIVRFGYPRDHPASNLVEADPVHGEARRGPLDPARVESRDDPRCCQEQEIVLNGRQYIDDG